MPQPIPRAELPIAHLFLAGVITAAGAALFWWVAGRWRPTAAPLTDTHPEQQDELDRLLLAATAGDTV
jgi:hypothetical protein